MTHHIQHQYDEILNASLPGLEIHIVYECESEISFDEDGNEESNRLLRISATVNSFSLPLPKFPEAKDGNDAREFLARLRESARQALWAKALKMARSFVADEWTEINFAAERWQRTGSTKIPTFGKPEKDFVI